jgi:hypothetical protein
LSGWYRSKKGSRYGYKNLGASEVPGISNEQRKKTERLEPIEEEPEGKGEAINLSEDEVVSQDWHIAYRNSIKNIEDLSRFISIPEEDRPFLKQAIKTFHTRIPLYYFSLIKDLNDINNPIRRQCVPSIEEIKGEIHEKIDPLGEEKTSPAPCLVHRYPDRACFWLPPVVLCIAGIAPERGSGAVAYRNPRLRILI